MAHPTPSSHATGFEDPLAISSDARITQAAPSALAQQSYSGGQTPVNIDGGLKAKGHPIGATGVSMTVEIVKQLRGEAGERQVPNVDIGLTHNVGGIGQYCFVHILRRD